jgi:hypothetical protein
VGTLLATGVGFGLAMRRLDPDLYRRAAGTQVVAQVTQECEYADGRRRGAKTNNATCKNATWTANGRPVVGSVEVRAQDIPGSGGPFQVTAWALGEHASAESRADRYPAWLPPLMTAPWWLLVVGLALAFGAPAAARRLPGRPDLRERSKESSPLRTYRRPLLGIAAGALALTGSVQLISGGRTVLGGLLAAVSALVLLTYAGKLVSVRRTRLGRARLASRHGWDFREVDPGLPQELGIAAFADARPGATSVVSGVREGVDFLVLDYRDKAGHLETVLLVRLATPVPGPAFMVNRGRLTGEGVPLEVQVRFDPDVLRRISEANQTAVYVDGGWIRALNRDFLSPGQARIVQRLDALIAAGAIIDATAPAERNI